MKTTQLIFFILFFLKSSYSQTLPYDTSYYSNGSIKKISYKKDHILSGYPVDTYYREFKSGELGFRWCDTMYWLPIRANKLSVRHYLDDKSILITDYKNVNQNYLNIEIPNGIQVIIFPSEKDSIFLRIWIYPDSTIESIIVGLLDTIDYKNKLTLSQSNFKKGTTIDEMSIINLGKYGNMSIKFFHHYFLEQIKYYWNDASNNLHIKEINFFDNLPIVKEIGNYNSKGREGTWYEYYESGVLKAKGLYELGMDGIKYQKNGVWTIFDQEGKTVKEEVWNNGKISRIIKKSIN